ncbi:transcription termination factor Rho [Bifidobacterium platyrrhinorum]|uniref:Transcription termination factor Rho n=1 Tax=Bifidobacterium platyrrhinorum TaxID=2661628 RepID=A0A6L9SU04_9BIFI|nr:transcription termination factor Rho [Bifidobacterium platyrrhinorum]NEG55283.1 transcription termination factor Rho [Bifidobacterium platyrrhinorum]
MANSQNLEDMKLPELKELAKQMGLRGTSTMRKPDLIATLQAARSGGEAPEGVTVRAPKAAAKSAKPAAAKSAKDAKNTEAAGEEAVAEQPQDTQAAPAPAAEAAERPAATASADAVASDAEQPAPAGNEAAEPVIDIPAKSARTVRSRRAARKGDDAERPSRRDRRAAEQAPLDAANLLDTLDLGKNAEESDRPRGRRHTIDENGDEIIVANVRRRRRPAEEREPQEEVVRDLDDILATLPTQNNAPRDEAEEPRRGRGDRDFGRGTHDDRADGRSERGERADRRGRRLRGRNRDFEERDERRGADHDVRETRADGRGERADRREEQNDLVPVAGIVDVLDSYAFVRTSGYLPGPNDVYVSMGQVKKYGLRKGDAVHGAIRAPREGDRRNQRQKFVPLQSIDSINGMSVEEAANRPQFNKLTPLYPQERLKQETAPNKLTGRIMDIVSPIGKGQRGLIVSPPKAGKTITLQNIANSITTNNPEVHLMVVLVDERPEEVTDMERTVQGEVISSTFDRPASDHTTVAELAIERAKRLVELGQDVVVLLDSMTRLARAYNIAAPASGRILSGGVDAQALYPPKKFFGAARNIENGGSLTIISSALVETGSKMDEVIFEEFKGTGNMELRLSRELADKRLFPAIDINASGTRREELITAPQELPIIYRLRRLLGGMEPEQAYQTLVPRLKKTATNRDFLTALVQQSGGGAVNGN